MADDSLRVRIAKWIGGTEIAGNGNGHQALASVSSRVDDSPGWGSLTGRPHDYDQATMQEHYADALTAWRKNPIAWRIIAITTNYVVGDRLAVSSPRATLARFINKFWNHPKNHMDLRLPEMSDELARSGDLFPVLFRNPQDGLSYLRFVTKDRIIKIETAKNDWETEIAYYEQQDVGEPKKWIAAGAPGSEDEDAVMLHYAVNKPMGALMGESDLSTMIPWLQRYSRMLEDRVRLHWAVRAFLWIVTVPSNKVQEKREQYRRPPEAGSIIVKDDGENWQVQAPTLRGADAGHDLEAVRQLIDAGSGYPPHWRGEPGNANLATAEAMQAPTERHLLRRQRYFTYMLQDLLYHAYTRGVQSGVNRKLGSDDYAQLFSVEAPDVSRSDNQALASATRDLTSAMIELSNHLPNRSSTFERLMLRLALRFAGEPQDDSILDKIQKEAGENANNGQGQEQEEEAQEQEN